MRQRKKRTRPPEYKGYPRTYLEDKRFMHYLKLMRVSLDTRRLWTIKKEAEYKQFEGHGVRSNEDTNPLWYKNLCSNYITERKNEGLEGKSKPRKRKTKFHDTRIRRQHVKGALEKLIKNGYSHSPYAEDFFRIAKTLYDQEELSNQLSRDGENEEVIRNQCLELIDLSLSVL